VRRKSGVSASDLDVVSESLRAATTFASVPTSNVFGSGSKTVYGA
jgi:hypothetical protein